MSQKVKVRWYCGYYVGEPKWQGLERYEPDECATEFDTEEDVDDWAEEICEAVCPSCGAELTQPWDSPQIMEDADDL